MLILMNLLKQAIKLVSLAISAILLVACGIATPAPIITATTTSSPTPIAPSITPSHTASAIPLPTNTSTVTLEPGIPPECMIHDEDGKLYVLSEKEFFEFGPSETKLDEVLVGN